MTCFSKKSHRWSEPPYAFSPKDISRLFSPFFEIRYIKEILNDRGGFRESFISALMEKPLIIV